MSEREGAGVALDLGDGVTVYVEPTVEVPTGGRPGRIDPDLRPRGEPMGKLAEGARKRFGDVAAVVDSIARQTTERLLGPDQPHRPSEVGLELKLGFDVDGNLYIVKGKAEASLTVSLKWASPPQAAPK